MSDYLVACIFRADTATFEVLPRYQARAREQFADGEVQMMEAREERSSASHAQYFAAVKEAHNNLNEAARAQLPTSEHLRKWALIKAGYFHETLMACETKQQAIAWALWMRRRDDYSEISAVQLEGEDGQRHWYFRLREAKSQRRAAMNKQQFEQSKRDVLDILAGEIEVRRRELEQAWRNQ